MNAIQKYKFDTGAEVGAQTETLADIVTQALRLEPRQKVRR